uniref:Putative g protein gamma30a n=1 Tax=Ixodes ricinus TaxID=34613 RepID=A0A131Y969_IXORI
MSGSFLILQEDCRMLPLLWGPMTGYTELLSVTEIVISRNSIFTLLIMRTINKQKISFTIYACNELTLSHALFMKEISHKMLFTFYSYDPCCV